MLSLPCACRRLHSLDALFLGEFIFDLDGQRHDIALLYVNMTQRRERAVPEHCADVDFLGHGGAFRGKWYLNHHIIQAIAEPIYGSLHVTISWAHLKQSVSWQGAISHGNRK